MDSDAAVQFHYLNPAFERNPKKQDIPPSL